MNHNEYPKSLERKAEAELLFIARDCQEALEANPTSARRATTPTRSYMSPPSCVAAVSGSFAKAERLPQTSEKKRPSLSRSNVAAREPGSLLSNGCK